jgi:hypothetical protein
MVENVVDGEPPPHLADRPGDSRRHADPHLVSSDLSAGGPAPLAQVGRDDETMQRIIRRAVR